MASEPSHFERMVAIGREWAKGMGMEYRRMDWNGFGERWHLCHRDGSIVQKLPEEFRFHGFSHPGRSSSDSDDGGYAALGECVVALANSVALREQCEDAIPWGLIGEAGT